jgi:predicted nucleic acid-binding protein
MYLLDTNVFNDVLDGKIPLSRLAGRRLFATHIQRDELNNTPDQQRRAALAECFERVAAEELSTSGAMLDVSRWDQGEWNDDDLLDKMSPVLTDLDKRAGKKRRADNQARDLLIAATAIKKNLTLVTNDANLKDVVERFGGRAVRMTEAGPAATT